MHSREPFVVTERPNPVAGFQFEHHADGRVRLSAPSLLPGYAVILTADQARAFSAAVKPRG